MAVLGNECREKYITEDLILLHSALNALHERQLKSVLLSIAKSRVLKALLRVPLKHAALKPINYNTT